MSASLRRIGAMIMRHVYVLRSSWPRILELVYWPTVQVALWAFLTRFLAEQSSLIAAAGGLFLSAVLLWDALFRCQLGLSLTFMEEMWARNLGHLFVSPLRPWEMVGSLFVVSLIRTLIGVGGAALLAIPFYGFWIGDALGPPLFLLFANMILFGWALGLVISGLVMRLGLAAESLAWGLVFLLQPVSGVYYPITTLPWWLQQVAWLFPPAWVFEGMRAILIENRLDHGLMLGAFLVNLAWMAAACLAFLLLFRSARAAGRLLVMGE